ncbi:hypothetical protein DACRYDRAFT_19506 [Dacryopinax primogenitus]|uniref:Uncharacterized protein n=1 Tax=Dacryopinax primogenitus (strain DJM 731) TaxID=1858805 RepID=M5GFG8_DACPD|nr:uncharacterized protein DACRYDRAFT_19506 [Dacryopinax primogenitus]EJU06277.1 hypothetical protein DACRYDRAFT_19506 [Dacryopinax primogenitus]
MPVDIKALAEKINDERIEAKTTQDDLREQIRRVKAEAEESRLAAARSRLAKIEQDKKVSELEAEILLWKHKYNVLEQALKDSKKEKEEKQKQWDALAVEVQRELVGAREKYEEAAKFGLARLTEAEDILRTRELGISDPITLLVKRSDQEREEAAQSAQLAEAAAPLLALAVVPPVEQPAAPAPAPTTESAPAAAPPSCERCARRAAKKAMNPGKYSTSEERAFSQQRSDYSLTSAHHRTFLAEPHGHERGDRDRAERRRSSRRLTEITAVDPRDIQPVVVTDLYYSKGLIPSPNSPRQYYVKNHLRQRSVSSKSSRKSPPVSYRRAISSMSGSVFSIQYAYGYRRRPLTDDFYALMIPVLSPTAIRSFVRVSSFSFQGCTSASLFISAVHIGYSHRTIVTL